MKKIFVTGLVLFAALCLRAQVPTTMSFQGYLTDKTTGDPLNGNFDLRFSLYDASTGGTELWFDDYAAVPVTKGLYSITLGDKKAIALPFDQVYYVQMKVGLETLDTRLRLNSSAYSISSTNASNLTMGKLVVANGGTGASTLTGIVVGNGTSAMTAVAKTGATQYFRSNAANNGYEFAALSLTNSDIASGAAIAGTKVVPTFGSQNISTSGTITGSIAVANLTGTLGTTNGGTGSTSLTGIVFGNGSGPLSAVAGSNAGFYLRRNLANNAYEFAQLSILSADIGDNSIVDADIASGAAISGSKISPSFGSQNISTTGNVNAGRVGLNITPVTTLHVSHGNGFTTNGITVENAGVASSNWNFYVNSTGDLALYKAGAIKGTFAGANGAYTSASDRRLKKDIEPIGDITADIMKLSPAAYRFKEQDASELKSIGFIAQDVMKIFPVLVKHNDETDIYTLDYSGFGVLAVKAIQEQQHKIDDLTNQIMELKRAVEILQSNLKK